jgi:tetratricopeptide (TPR) repeat protein
MDSQVDQLIRRGKAAFDRRDYVAALDDFRAVLDQCPQFADIRHLAGLCYNFLGEPAAALEELDGAVAINERYVEAHLNRSLTLQNLGRLEEAAEAFRRASEYGSSESDRFPAAVMVRLANAHAAVGDLYREVGASEEAIGQYRAALELRPRFADIRTNLGMTLLDATRFDEAEREFLQALEGNPRYLAARLNLGLLEFRRGDRNAARREWSLARDQAPDNPQVRAYLAMLDSGEGAGDGAADVDA